MNLVMRKSLKTLILRDFFVYCRFYKSVNTHISRLCRR